MFMVLPKTAIFSCEMQTGKRKELPKRSRYYHSCLDLDLISVGEPYEKLAKTFVIFFCTFDPFQQGRHIYTFENTCKENPDLLLGDENITIFLNTKGTLDDVDAEMKEFLAYIENTTDAFAEAASSSLVKQIHKRVTDVKQNKEMEVAFMTLLQRDREYLEEGVRQMAALTDLLLSEGRTEDLKRGMVIYMEYSSLWLLYVPNDFKHMANRRYSLKLSRRILWKPTTIVR